MIKTIYVPETVLKWLPSHKDLTQDRLIDYFDTVSHYADN